MERRIPRPLGVTYLMSQYHSAEESLKEEIKTRIISHVVNQWALNNGLLCNESHNVNSLAKYLCCDISDIQYVLQQRLLSNRLWDREKQEELLSAVTGWTLTMAMEDRMEAASQVEILKRSQGDHYVPFISSELRQALDLKMKAGSNLSAVVKQMSGGSLNIFNQQVNVAPENTTGDFITKQEALKMVEVSVQQALPSNEDTVKYLEEKYHNFEGLPEVNAKKQIGIDASKEGLDFNKTELLQITDNYNMHRESAEDVDFHEIRRAVELGIDEEEDVEFKEP